MNYLLKFSLFLFIFGGFQSVAFSQEVLGKWKVTNEQGRVNSIVEIYKNGQAYYGKVVRITKEEDRDKRCEKCPGELKNRPIEGLNVIRGFEKEGDEYINGILLDPKSGKEYKGKIWIDEDEPDKLNVRGYVAFFYKTKTWERAE
ncbi:DUF2147 domain-containing protein [Salegentibacter sp. HM20]